MDASEAVEVIKDRISRLEPEYVAKKIIGFIYFQGFSDQEMIRLALGPDTVIHDLIQKAKNARLLAPQPVISPTISPTINPTAIPDPSYKFGSFSPALSPRPFSPATSPHSFPTLRRVPPYWDPRLATEQLPPQAPVHNQSFKLVPFSEPIPVEYGLPNQYMALEDQAEVVRLGETVIPSDYYGLDDAFNHLSIRGSRNSGLMDFPVKTCRFFNEGYCKHGSGCRFFHVEASPESYRHQMFGPGPYEDDQVFSPGSLEKIEAEITELLRSRRGSPVSIASLPMMYYEKFGKTLQAEGYLTESQRHGKAGYSLTKLLARLKNSIRLIDRPHGQHAVILAEDAPKYMDIRGERNDPGPIVNGSCQIYLTFPAESTFSEEDVSNYFSSYGQVEDVRIPCQQKRMFGFVTFASAETVKHVLNMGKPHIICGARVLVKPYREKSKLVERRYQDKFDHSMYYHSHPGDIDSEFLASCQPSRLFRRQLMEAQKQPVPEVEVLRLSQLQLGCKPVPYQSSFIYPMDELKVPQDHLKFPSAQHFNYLMGVFNSGSATASGDNPPIHSANNCGDQESVQGLSLPDSPFASTVGSSISAVI